MCPEDTLIPINKGMDEAYRDGGGYPTPSDVELHGYHLFHGTGDFERLHEQHQRAVSIDWYGDALGVIAGQSTIRIFIQGVDTD